MDEEALRGLGPQADAASQQKAMVYFEQMKSSMDGWKICASTLSSSTYNGQDHIKFFCLQVIEYFLKTRYARSSADDHTYMKSFLHTYIDLQRSEQGKSFLRNKVAQVMSLVFVTDFPSRWESFLTDLLTLLPYGETVVDLYLRTLMAIDSEVVDREIVHTAQECERNTLIKDHMRIQCVPQLVQSWYDILTIYESTSAGLVNSCLQVIGAYISWIDIGLIANEKFVSILLRFMSNVDLREAACDCILEIIVKGMDPVSKMDLIQSFMSVLLSAGIFKMLDQTNDEEIEYYAKLSKLINGIGLQLILCWQKLTKNKDEAQSAVALNMLEDKIPLMLRFLRDEDDDISSACSEFAHDYITVLKQCSQLQNHQKEHIKNLMFVVMEKMKYDDSYNHETEGEDEAEFQRYRKELRDIFNNLGALDAELVLSTIHHFFTSTISNWRDAKYQDVELAVTLLYNVAECLPSSKGQHFTGDSPKVSRLQEMMRMLVSSRMSFYTHPAVTLQYFETIARYDKFFNIEPQYVADVLMSFLDDRGLRNGSAQVRSRVAYLFSRFVRSLNRAHLSDYLDVMLDRCHDLLVLHIPDNGSSAVTLTSNDQLFIYETVGILIVNSNAAAEKKQQLMHHLLSPVVSKYDHLLQCMVQETDEDRQALYAQTISNALNYASRTSKGFSMQQTVAQCGCVEVFTETLEVFLHGLDVPVHRPVLHAGIRQFLHRMVVCLDTQVLPYVPMAMEKLLGNADARELHDFIPLINQVVTKFKKIICPYLVQVFMPIVKTIFDVLSMPVDDRDQVAANDRCLLQRSYFLFLSTLITNQVAEVLIEQTPENLHTVLMTLIQGAAQFDDVPSQKSCFNVLAKLVALWGSPDAGLQWFVDFIYKEIVPACFLAPMKPSFDLTDAQTVLALNESGLCMKAILDKRGDELLQFLKNSYMPTLNLSADISQEYITALQSDTKVFRNYLKVFFSRAKS